MLLGTYAPPVENGMIELPEHWQVPDGPIGYGIRRDPYDATDVPHLVFGLSQDDADGVTQVERNMLQLPRPWLAAARAGDHDLSRVWLLGVDDVFEIHVELPIEPPLEPPTSGFDAIPDPTEPHPTSRAGLESVVFLSAELDHPLIDVGDYTYYTQEPGTPPFLEAAVKYLYGPQRLRIGRFTTIGPGVTFLMPGGNHPMVGPSTYPFTMFGGAWGEATMDAWLSIDQPGDTVVGSDVWFGRGAIILPGVTIGHGAVIGAHAVVTKDVAPYAVVAGNPAREVRRRFIDEDVAALLDIAWWNWPVEDITRHAAVIMSGTPQELAAVRPASTRGPAG